MDPEIVFTADGTRTLRHACLGELYHSDRGAVSESLHVFVGAGLQPLLDRGRTRISVFEMGFGTGLNALLTLERAAEHGVAVDYRAVELYPLSGAVVEALEYGSFEGGDAPPERIDRFRRLHGASWGSGVFIHDSFCLTKYPMSLLDFPVEWMLGSVDLIYFDAFSPEVQPELWTPQVMHSMHGLLAPGGVLVTYSAKGSVKEALRLAGFRVERLPGALGKRHMVRAVKTHIR